MEQPGTKALTRHGAFAHYQVETPSGTVHVFNVHLATPRQGLNGFLHDTAHSPAEIDANIALRREQSTAVHATVREVTGRFLLVGDFNTPPESAIYREYWSSWRNAFSESGWGWGYSFRTRHASVRIDHLIAGPGWRWQTCWVGPDIGSPHRPVLADVVQEGASD
jgi:endonuclease/exonuclease/phosphatase family metal-dependent hydrolase